MPNKSKLPDGWEDYCPFGEVIERTCILPLKVPLKESLSNKYEEAKRFTPQTLIDMLNDRGLTLGLIIDLTFTTKYYNPEEFTNKGIYYQKIFVEGHSVPSDEAVYQLFEIINTFQQHVNFDNNYIIGIHCTHGVNRTGYMVCRFLMDVLGWKSHEAVDAFSKARFHPIDRENYINDLHRRGKLWEDYCPFGEVIERTCILPLKVPLKESLSNKYEEAKRFTPQTLIDMLNDRGLTLGLIIDLTFTTKYYNPEEFTNKGIYYQKIFVEGHSVPSDEAVYQLFEIINTFQQHVNFDNNYIIGIHCTHGVNRTGYMVCRFLMDVLGWKSHEAVDAFSKARFHPIDRENYINDLHRRGKLREREMAMVPSFMPQGPMLQGPSRGGFQRGGWRGDHAGFGGGGRGGFNFGGPGPSFSRKSGDVWGMNEINFDEDEYLTSWRHGEGGRGGGGRGRGGFGRGGGGRGGGMRERFQPYNTRGRGGKRGGHRETTEFTSWKEAGAMNQAVNYD